jgi:hypothetical protein
MICFFFKSTFEPIEKEGTSLMLESIFFFPVRTCMLYDPGPSKIKCKDFFTYGFEDVLEILLAVFGIKVTCAIYFGAVGEVRGEGAGGLIDGGESVVEGA